MQSSPRAAHGIGDGGDGLVLPDDPFVELLLQVQQLVALALQHAGDGNARPAAHHFGDIIGGDLFAYQRVAALGRGQLRLDGLDVILQRLQFRVAYLRHPAVVALALGTLGLQAQVLHLLLVLLNLVDKLALAFPLGTELGLLLFQLGNVLVQLGYLRLVTFALDGLALDFELGQTARNLVQFLGYRVALHPQFGGSLVHQVDGLVGQEPF